ncbi:APC family permease [Microlunatus parietis]|uniref:APA family basic amino acid/polyamine antiporter n=1 Tax=Microlunatus parietis TaxID=682979 RepID=A0A7Y9IE41_9ACTN|nr:APC family permease [Microlunatus parietis]NYE75095.1 APA family basic amino acid/polyamine antiporter [Microlunatus parietis]
MILNGELHRRLGVGDAVTVGLAAMIGAGVFAVFGPAAGAAGTGLPIALAVAALIAYCNATSSARLAARYPDSGGTYVYGRERLGPFWGYLAGWGFVVGKTASCAAMALTAGWYLWPDQAHLVAVAAVLVLTVINCLGVQKAAWASRLIVGAVLLVLATVVIIGLTSPAADPARLALGPDASVWGVLQAAGLIFFAFAGYARVATLGEEVRQPERTIPIAVGVALGIVLILYAVVGATVIAVLGPDLAGSIAPLSDLVIRAGVPGFLPVVAAGAALAALGSLLAMILGVSRTALAMARDRHLPPPLAAIHPRFAVPHRTIILVGLVVALLAGLADLRSVIGFSSFAVLVYYAIANASALTLSRAEGRPPRAVPIIGLIGCLVVAAALPPASALTGAAVLLVGAIGYVLRTRLGGRSG